MTDNNMELWDAVSKTDPAHTKQVSFGRKFTAIDAHYQIREMTRHFGPVGKGWRYKVEYNTIQVGEHHLACADVVLEWRDEEEVRTFGPVRGCDTLYTPPPPVDMAAMQERLRDATTRSDGGFNAKGFENALRSLSKSLAPRIDNDAFKKATTDALTKLISHLGFNADVFMGQFDDNKYVEKMRAEFSPDHQKASQYLGAVRKAIADNDELGGKELIGEIKDPATDNAAMRALWGMLSTAERETFRGWM